MRTQRGLGLVEVMIALTIGLVLLLGVTGVFTTMRRTSLSMQQLSGVQNQQRMAMYFLHAAISGAGNNPDPMNNSSATLYPITVAPAFTSATQALTGTGDGSSGADQLSVRFTAATGGAEQGCSAAPTAGDVYTDTFSVAGGYLVCTETDNTAATAASTINLIPGVSAINVLYGVDTSNSGSATQYKSAAQVTTAGLWNSVKTAQVTLLFTNALAGQPGQPATVSLTETILFMANI